MFDLHFNQPRRDFLRVGGLTALGLSLPALMRAHASAADSRSRRAKSVIWFISAAVYRITIVLILSPKRSKRFVASTVPSRPMCLG